MAEKADIQLSKYKVEFAKSAMQAMLNTNTDYHRIVKLSREIADMMAEEFKHEISIIEINS